MKIAITTVGSRGDLQPYIALGLGLQAAGYEVRIISAKNEADFVQSFGLPFFALNVDIQALMAGDEVQAMAKGNNPIQFFVSHLKGSKTLKKLMVATQAEIWEGCRDADIIIFHPGMPLGFFMAQAQQKISVMANPFPVIATPAYPSILFYTQPRLGALYNSFTHFLFGKLFWSLTKPALATFWKTTGLPTPNFAVPPVQQQIASGMPVLNGYSSRFFAPSVYWRKNIHTTGSWVVPPDPNYVPPPDLLHFIESGEPPIYIGFGSMKDRQAFGDTFELIKTAMTQTAERAVIGLGWNQLEYGAPIPDTLFLVENVPHTWLFPKMKMVVHHGGAGTTAAGLTAGKPTLIIPHNADQPAWGQRVYELGVGAKPIKKAQLTVTNLAAALQYALQPHIVANAAQLGQQLQAENGVAQAVQVIDQYIAQQKK